eukprot:TRINITY_DN2726_c0_g1_i2.p1 TRINITY_DN2726_c0_g1~~TRINITY_DN2726_c0_g1_i2.p1  ORF type:complete len:189 (+),score=29.44 TRINITY_DN2726_c0_g1_i2:55-621(+)
MTNPIKLFRYTLLFVDLLSFLFMSVAQYPTGIALGLPGFIYCCLVIKYLHSNTHRSLLKVYIILRAAFWGMSSFICWIVFAWNDNPLLSVDGFALIFTSVNFIGSFYLQPDSKEIKVYDKLPVEEELIKPKKKLHVSQEVQEVDYDMLFTQPGLPLPLQVNPQIYFAQTTHLKSVSYTHLTLPTIYSV